ncbi:MAG: DUF2905 domain-containing protein [Candidatus Omnitrophota bacterium]
MPVLGKYLIILGIILIGLGLSFWFFSKIPFLGKLPGDIHIEKKNFTFSFPLATCILLSLFASLFFWFFPRR